MKTKVKANQNIVDNDFVKKTKVKMKVYSPAEIAVKTDAKLTVKEKEQKAKREPKSKVK